VTEDDGDDIAEVVWEAEFDPADGVEEAKAVEVISGIFDAGIESIGKKAGDAQ
jgi:hypothetical protein